MARGGGSARALKAQLKRAAEQASNLRVAARTAMVPAAQAAAALARELAAELGSLGAVPYTRAAHHRMLLRLRERVAAAELNIASAARAALARSLDDSAKLALSHARAGVLPKRVEADVRRALVARHDELARKLASDISADMRRQLAAGVKRRETAAQVQERVRRLGGIRSPGVEQSLATRYRHRLDRAADTESSVAYNQAQSSIAVRAGLLQRWVTWPPRVCRICRPLDGEVRAVGEAFTGGYAKPPIHPYCKCTIQAVEQRG